VLGSTFEGAAEVSLVNAQVLRTWPLAIHDVRCSGGIAPGPAAGQVIVRGGNGTTELGHCEHVYRSRPYDASGIGPSTGGGIPHGGAGLSAVLGPLTVVLTTQNQSGTVFRCATAGELWSECQILANNVYGNVVGYEAGYLAKRIIPLARASTLHDLQTGDMVAELPDDPAGRYYTAAAFSASEDSVYVTSNGNSGVYSGTNGWILAVDAASGAVLDEIDVSDGLPLAIAIDDARDWILAVINNRVENRVWLRVYSRTDHTMVVDLPVDDVAIVSAVKDHYHFRLVLDRIRNHVTLVSTARVRTFQNTPILRMAIARWSLPPE
jgi:hypothetical protein